MAIQMETSMEVYAEPIQTDNVERVKNLMDAGYPYRFDALISDAIINNSTDVLSYLIKRLHPNLNFRLIQSAFLHAIEQKYVYMVHLLLEAGIDRNFNNGMPFVEAIHSDPTILSDLLDHGAEMNPSDIEWSAARFGKSGIIEVLLKRGVDFRPYIDRIIQRNNPNINDLMIKYNQM